MGQLNKKITPRVKRTLGLTSKTANQRRGQLVESGYLTRGEGRSGEYRLTTAGAAYLSRLQIVDDATIPDELRLAQRTYLLLQVLDASDGRLSKADAHKIPKEVRDRLDLVVATANIRREQLVGQGYLRIVRLGRSTEFELTPDGLDYLVAGGSHLDHAEFRVKGRTLNRLVAAARENSFGSTEEASISRSVPPKSQLSDAVLKEFEELRRERHGFSKMVPIHEIRERIAQRFGIEASRHDVLDDAIIDLWRMGRLRLVAISDVTKATADQLDASIPGNSETLFYVEAVELNRCAVGGFFVSRPMAR
jgi:hypothetical protein